MEDNSLLPVLGHMKTEISAKSVNEARASWPLGMYLLKIKISHKRQYYTIFLTYEQRLFFIGFPATAVTIATGNGQPLINVDYIEI